MAGPWEKYQAPAETGPWTKYAPTQPETTPSQSAPIKPKGIKDMLLSVPIMPSGLTLRDAGNLAAGGVRGAGSIGATILAPLDVARDAIAGKGLSLESNRQRRQDMTDALQSLGADTDSLTFGAGKLGGEIAGTAGVGGLLANGARALGAAPTLVNSLASGGMTTGAPAAKALSIQGAKNMATRMAGGALTGGATAGLVSPENAGTGALVGGALPPSLAALSGFRTLGAKLSPIGSANKDLARTAIEKYEIPLGVADVSSNGTIKALRSTLNDVPIVGGIGSAQREGVQAGFNKAVGGTFGAPEKKLTVDVVEASKKRMGKEFDRIWDNNALKVDDEMFGKLTALQRQAAKLPKNEGGSLNAEINDLLSKVQAGPDGAAIIPGDVANNFQSYLRRRAEGSAGMKNELGDLRQSIISAFNRSVRPEDAAALTVNRAQYKAFKTVEPLLNSAEAGVAGRVPGDIPAALLPQAVARQYSNAGNTPLGELSQIGSRFIVDRTPRTGGSMRAALQNLGIGTAIVGAGAVNPALAVATLPAAAGVNGLLGSPSIARRLVSERPPNELIGLLANPEMRGLLYKSAPVLTSSR